MSFVKVTTTRPEDLVDTKESFSKRKYNQAKENETKFDDVLPYQDHGGSVAPCYWSVIYVK